MTKTDAAAQTLGGINPDVVLEPYTMNITTVAGFDAFKSTLLDPGSGKRRAFVCRGGQGSVIANRGRQVVD
jgi:hypothetical protein